MDRVEIGDKIFALEQLRRCDDTPEGHLGDCVTLVGMIVKFVGCMIRD